MLFRYWVLLVCFGLACAACGDDATSDGPGDEGDGDAGAPDGEVVDRCSADTDCDNDLYCDGEEVCVEGACLPGLPVRCTDGIECTIDRCSEALRECETLPPDLDGDGHNDANCEDESGEPFGDDCDDTDALRFPGNIETCDDRDDDCNPETLGEKDTDGDAFMDALCCNDGNCGEDCDDLKPSVNPTATEACDHFDNDCNGVVDEGVSVDVYPDADRDGHGADVATVERCAGTVGFALTNDDCNDNDPEMFLGQFEICDGKDNNCSGIADEIHQDAPWFLDVDEDTFGDPASTPIFSCERVTGRVLSHNDCQDENPAVHPAAAETCDGVDNDCNGAKDYNLDINDFEDDDNDDLADDACGAGAPDCNDLDASTGAGLDEICDQSDNDCDDKIDEQTAQTVWYLDLDGDGWGVDLGTALARCEPIPGRAANLGDCRDDSTEIHPGAAESCEGTDQDCDGRTDEESDHLCALTNAIAGCNFGACDVLACYPGYGDIDDVDSNGCEATAPLTKLPDVPGDTCTIDADCTQWDTDYCNGREVCFEGLCYYGTPVVCSGPNVLQGSFSITNSFHIQQLAEIETITGDLTITGTTALQTLAGLGNLKVIGGNLTVTGTQGLTSLTGLSGLTTVGGSINIDGNTNLTALDLPALVTAGSILIEGNGADLVDVAGFGSLATVYGLLRIYDNEFLVAVSGFGALRSVGTLDINYNGLLASMSGFGSLEEVLQNLDIHQNAHTSIAFPKLKTVMGNLNLDGVDFANGYPPNYSTLSISLPELDYVGKELTIRQFWNLATLNLGKLRRVDVLAAFQDLTSVETLSLPSLTTVGGFEVANNAVLDTLSLPKLANVATSIVSIPPSGTATGDFYVRGNALTSLSLPELLTVDGTMDLSPDYYYYDTLLVSVTAPKLHTIGGSLYLSDLDALTTISMNALTTISNSLDMYDCSALTSLTLPQLATIGGSLYLRYNDVLASITMGSLASTGYFQIYDHPLLATLSMTKLATITGSLYIAYNTPLSTITSFGLRNQSNVLQMQLMGTDASFYYNSALCTSEINTFIADLTTNGFTGTSGVTGNNDSCQ